MLAEIHSSHDARIKRWGKVEEELLGYGEDWLKLGLPQCDSAGSVLGGAMEIFPQGHGHSLTLPWKNSFQCTGSFSLQNEMTCLSCEGRQEPH